MAQRSDQERTIRTLLERLERISADSTWAHRASGLRGALLDAQSALEQGAPLEQAHLAALLEHGFKLLAQAARERGFGKAR